MKNKRTRTFNFNEDMEQDLQFIKESFRSKFKIEPSNTAILNFLMKTYKESKVDIRQKPRRKKTFIVRF